MEQSLWQPEIGEEVIVTAEKNSYHNAFEPGTRVIIVLMFEGFNGKMIYEVKSEGDTRLGRYYKDELKPDMAEYSPSQVGDRDDDV